MRPRQNGRMIAWILSRELEALGRSGHHNKATDMMAGVLSEKNSPTKTPGEGRRREGHDRG